MIMHHWHWLGSAPLHPSLNSCFVNINPVFTPPSDPYFGKPSVTGSLVKLLCAPLCLPIKLLTLCTVCILVQSISWMFIIHSIMVKPGTLNIWCSITFCDIIEKGEFKILRGSAVISVKLVELHPSCIILVIFVGWKLSNYLGCIMLE